MAATSSFTEGSSVFGGQANLVQAILNIFTIYDPEVIAVHTTCLSETIGDDIPQIISKAKDEGKIPDGKLVIHANTPSYVGAHVTGFSAMVKAMVDYLAEPSSDKHAMINLIPGWVEPADMREIKRLATLMGVETIMFPDTSAVLDAPQTGKHKFYPDGGVTIAELRRSGGSRATIALGASASDAAATALEEKCGVPAQGLPLPIGLRATDRYIDALRQTADVAVPAVIEEERGQLVDLITDMQQYFFGKRVALWGDPDQLLSLVELLLDLEMRPVYIVTGTPNKTFGEQLRTMLSEAGIEEAKVMQGARADMFLLHQWIKNESVDLLIGNTYGKYIARDEDIPLVRHGFPILDRVGHTYFPTVGYRGAMRLLEQILDRFLDRQDRDAPEASFELVM